MYPFERKIGSSKQTIKQRGRIEGSFVQGHIGRETGDFNSYYFGNDVSCRRNRPNRDDEDDIDPLFPPISIFNQNGRGSKKRGKRGFTDMEMQSAVTHILLNCPESQSYVKIFQMAEEVYDEYSSVQHLQLVKEVALGPASQVLTMNKYCVNGFKFQTEEVSRNKKTNNSGVYIQGDVDGTGQTIEYYGVIQEIIEVRNKADWWVVIKSKPVGRIEIDNVLDVAYQNDVAIVQQQVDVELETTLQHPQHILEKVSNDEILNVEEEISENEKNESFDVEEWDDNENETTEEEKRRMMELKQRILGNIILIIVYQSVLQLLHNHCLHDATRTYLYRLFIEHNPYGQVLHLPQRFVHPDVSPSSTATPSATPHDTMSALAPGQKDRLGRIMIESDGSSWHPAKDAARGLKGCVRRLYTQAYHSWSEILNSILQALFNNFKTMCTWESRYNLVIGTTFERKASARLSSWIKSVRDSGERPGWMLPHVFDELGQYWNTYKFKAISNQAKMARGSLKGGSLHTGGAKTVGAIAREMEKELGCTPIEPEVFKKTHVRKKENESDPDVWVEERAERTFALAMMLDASGLEGIGSSRQAEALNSVQIAAMSDQIAKLTATLAESERKRVAEQESMSETVQQIKEQVMNLAYRPTTLAPDDTDDESDDDDYADLTP
ncbi:hypothetical protein MTR67_048548 [Solanum verrucosum]|uniref:DUF4218 domain-containing protein n=1 Tax=Solanum verrucosum TaxID=315347 RepID=A0AAF0UY62_SOLVR|nr:hypothetical protein MTR67_048548 [Solanum verrucosum]